MHRRLDDEIVERMPPITDGPGTDVGVDRFVDANGIRRVLLARICR